MITRIVRSLRRAAALAVLFALTALFTAAPAIAANPTLGTPTIVAGTATQTTIDITFTAGTPGGAPAGFTIQWMTQADYLANGGWSSALPSYCDASFAGPANPRYVLSPGQSVTVTPGNFTADAGFSSTCATPLVCGTTYVFRAFAHGNSSWGRSAFSSTITASTSACSFGCALSQGYWKTHGPVPVGGNLDTWPVTSLTLGALLYTDTQLLSILNQQPLGNGLVSLAHQLIAVKLSIANGADGSAIATTVADADSLIGSLMVPPVGSDYLDPTATASLTDALDSWIATNECNSN